jgi:predicted Zn-dependent protease
MGFAFTYPEKWETVNSPARLGFVHPDKKAQIIFDLSDTSKTMKEQANEIESGMYKSYHVRPIENAEQKINGNTAHLLRYDLETNNGPVMLAVVWTQLDDITYRIAQISKGRMDDAIALAKSLHKITKKERGTIYQTVLDVVQSKGGETLEQLSARTGNVLDIPYLSLINDIDSGTKIPQGRWLKIGVKQLYK